MDIVWIFIFILFLAQMEASFIAKGALGGFQRCCANKEFQCVQHIPRLDCRLNRKNK